MDIKIELGIRRSGTRFSKSDQGGAVLSLEIPWIHMAALGVALHASLSDSGLYVLSGVISVPLHYMIYRQLAI